MSNEPKVAYISMEAGLRPDLPTVAGGLGFLTGDVLKGSADINFPMVGVTLRHHKGYFKQVIENGEQKEVLRRSNPFGILRKRDDKVKVSIEGRDVTVGAEEYVIKNGHNNKVPVYFLDTRLDENIPVDKEISENCYWNGKYVCDEEFKKHRFKQEVVLGIGGVRFLKKLGYNIKKYHMNEGHGSLAAVEVARERDYNVDQTKKLCSFTTHTPVAAGYDRFPCKTVDEVIGDGFRKDFIKFLGNDKETLNAGENDWILNMAELGMNLSGKINAVSKKHAVVANKMHPGKNIAPITNAVHLGTWTSGTFKGLFDKYFEGWEEEPAKLKDALTLPSDEVWKAHLENKYTMIDFIEDEYGTSLDRDKLTLGWFRRMADYKRPTLIFTDRERLKSTCSGNTQLIFAGKAHPRDGGGKYAIKRIHEEIKNINGEIPTVFVENYRMEISPILISGVDVLLNTPITPKEASGTSGMKGAANGVLNYTKVDGWFWEEFPQNEGKIGWSFGREGASDWEDAQSMYKGFEEKVIPIFYKDRDKWIEMQKHSISLASHYHTKRLLEEYKEKIWS